MYWALLDGVLDYIDQASQTVKKKFDGLKSSVETGDNGVLTKIVGFIIMISLLFYKLLSSLFGWSSSTAQHSSSKDSGASMQSYGGISVGERITGQDIFDAAVGGKAVVTSHWGADRSWNRSAVQRAEGNTKHKGVDIQAAYGTQLYAPFDGVIERVNRSNAGTGGRSLHIIDHEHGIDVIYMHLSEIQVESGQRVTKGEPIAKSGASGHGQDHKYAPHLHLQIRRVGREWEDPEKFVYRIKKVIDDELIQAESDYIEVSEGSGGSWSRKQKERAKHLMNRLISAGLTVQQAAGIAGNVMKESSFMSFNKRVMDSNGLYSGGIVMWNGGNLKDIERYYNKDISSISYEEQVDYLVKQIKQKNSAIIGPKREGSVEAAYGLKSGASVYDVMKRTTSVEDAANSFERVFEGSGDYKKNKNKERKAFAVDVYEIYQEAENKANLDLSYNALESRVSARVIKPEEGRRVDKGEVNKVGDANYLAEEMHRKNIFNSETISHVGIVFETNRRLQG